MDKVDILSAYQIIQSIASATPNIKPKSFGFSKHNDLDFIKTMKNSLSPTLIYTLDLDKSSNNNLYNELLILSREIKQKMIEMFNETFISENERAAIMQSSNSRRNISDILNKLEIANQIPDIVDEEDDKFVIGLNLSDLIETKISVSYLLFFWRVSIFLFKFKSIYGL